MNRFELKRARERAIAAAQTRSLLKWFDQPTGEDSEPMLSPAMVRADKPRRILRPIY